MRQVLPLPVSGYPAASTPAAVPRGYKIPMASRVPQSDAATATLPRTSVTVAKAASADHTWQCRPPSTAAFSVRTDPDRVVHVYTADRTSSGGSASAQSPASSGGSRSVSSDSWSEIDDDDIEPSDSASRLRRSSRRHTVEAKSAPSRRHSSRRVVEREEIAEPPTRQSSRRHHSRHESRHENRYARSSSRRLPTDESSSSVASPDDYPPYGHQSMPHAPYPHSGYRHLPAVSRAGYPPSVTTGPGGSVTTGPGGYHELYAQDPRQALVSMRHDPFGYPVHSNPFSPHSQQPNPFSPMRDDQCNYFAQEPMVPPPPQRHQPEIIRRPQSFAAPSHYETDTIIAPYQPPYPPPGPWGMPPYGPYPPVPGWPHSAGSSPPPKEEKNAEMEALKKLLEKRNEDEDKDKKDKISEIEALKQLIKKHEEERVAREKAWIAEREAEAAAKAAEKAKAEEEKKRKQEIEEAKKKAKEDAEKKAEDAAKKAKEEHETAAKKAKEEHEAATKKAKDEAEKKLAESEKAKEEAAKKAKELEDEIAKNKPTPDSLKAPIRFKDAVGRKFSFPWHICKTWKGMEMLIKQAFLHVDMIGEHVHQGHYDLTGPDGEIILPQVWDTMVQPDWEITMHLWPMEEEKQPPKDDPPPDPFANLGVGGGFPADVSVIPEFGPPKKGKGGKAKDGKGGKRAKGGSPEIIEVMPGPMGGMGGGIPPPPPAGFGDPFAGMGFPGIPAEGKKPKPRGKSVRKEIRPLAAWFAGGAISNSKARKSK